MSQPISASSPSSFKDFSAVGSAHSLSEPMFFGPLSLLRLICSYHPDTSSLEILSNNPCFLIEYVGRSSPAGEISITTWLKLYNNYKKHVKPFSHQNALFFSENGRFYAAVFSRDPSFLPSLPYVVLAYEDNTMVPPFMTGVAVFLLSLPVIRATIYTFCPFAPFSFYGKTRPFPVFTCPPGKNRRKFSR